jgi:Animal haem peroxidase
MAQGQHGTGIRGISYGTVSSSTEARFGRLFRTIPAAAFDEADLRTLGSNMTAEFDPKDDNDPDVHDPEENPGISAGYTYLGQFIDHDITFDPASMTQKIKDGDALEDFRTPQFDLDNVYGRGPDDQPYLYQPDGIRMLLGEPLSGSDFDPGARDLPRNNPGGDAPRRALIGDPRNDENRIVAQLQAAFLRFHNRMADHLASRGTTSFAEVRRAVVWHYQWIVLHDFLPTIVGADMVRQVLPHLDLEHPDQEATIRNKPPQLRLFLPERRSFMPYEFAVAAYRFGHSMIRPIYRLNADIVAPIFAFRDTNDKIIQVKKATVKDTLGGFGVLPQGWAIDWRNFFALADAGAPKAGRVQPAYKIDTSLVNPLVHLPGFDQDPPATLASRNLIRGVNLRLPSGQHVAQAMSIVPIKDEELIVGKATEDDKGDWKPLASLSRGFYKQAPLWFYVLAEAMQPFVAKPDDKMPITLGPVGGRIVAETFAGLLIGDSTSYLCQAPLFRPDPKFAPRGRFGIAELLRAVAS